MRIAKHILLPTLGVILLSFISRVALAAPPPTPTCPCSIWSESTMPTVVDAGAGGAVELGVKFTASVNGTITGIRFYKSAANTGTHIGNLWTIGGSLMASATFTGEANSGGQTGTLSP